MGVLTFHGCLRLSSPGRFLLEKQMAKYRPIFTKIWKDPKLEKLSPPGKLLFVYLCTNESTTESGIYPISIRTIANETGLKQATVNKLLSNGLINVFYDFDNCYVFVKNFLKHNGGGRPDLLVKSILNDNEKNPTPLWQLFIKRYPEYSENLNSWQTDGEQFINCSIEIGSDIEIEDKSKSKKSKKGSKVVVEKEKIQYAEFVTMAKEEHKKLIEKLGESVTKEFIERLDNWKGSTGKTKKSDYRTILIWVDKEKKEQQQETDDPYKNMREA